MFDLPSSMVFSRHLLRIAPNILHNIILWENCPMIKNMNIVIHPMVLKHHGQTIAG